MLETPETLVFIGFSFAAAIFHALLGLERSVWAIAWSQVNSVDESDLRRVHRTLQGLSSYLPPSNGLAAIIGLAGLIWQVLASNWSLFSIFILALWAVGQAYILTFGKIVQAVKYLRRTDSNGEFAHVRSSVRHLIRQHFNGLLHASAIVIAEIALVILK